MSKVAYRVLQPLLLLAEQKGICEAELLRHAGIASETVKPQARLPESIIARICKLAVEFSGDPLFAIKGGLSASAQSLGVLGYVLQNSATIRAAYAQLQRYWQFLHDEPLFHLQQDKAIARISFRSDTDAAVVERRALVEYLLSFLLRLSGLLLGSGGTARQALMRIDFRFDRPDRRLCGQYKNLLACEDIRFGQMKTAVEFRTDLFGQCLPLADADLRELFEQQLRHSLPPDDQQIIQQLRGLLRACLPGHLLTLPELANELAISRASLQRRLAAAGSSYRELVQQLRCELAQELLHEPQYSLVDIAFMLGFADAASFHHAYKRWTGETPLQTRQSG